MTDQWFATTRWSLIRRAHGDGEESRRALGELCVAYWQPLYVWLRRDGHDEQSALDLVQSFLAEVLERGHLGIPEGGRFRAYALGAIRNFASNDRRRGAAQKRGGDRTRIDGEASERLLDQVSAVESAPGASFDRAWALALLDRAMSALEREFRHRGQEDRFAAMRPLLDGAEAQTQDVAAALDLAVGAVRVAVHRARSRLGELIRAEIRDTVDDPSEVESELQSLREILAKPSATNENSRVDR